MTWKPVPSSVPAPGAVPSATQIAAEAFSVPAQRSCCLRRANHQDLVMAFHLARTKY